MLVGQSAMADMLVSQSAGIGRQVCRSVNQLWQMGRYLGWSICWGG